MAELDLVLDHSSHSHQNVLQLSLVVDFLELGAAAVLHLSQLGRALVDAGTQDVDADGWGKEQDEVGSQGHGLGNHLV